jgi:hypothetical protein
VILFTPDEWVHVMSLAFCHAKAEGEERARIEAKIRDIVGPDRLERWLKRESTGIDWDGWKPWGPEVADWKPQRLLGPRRRPPGSGRKRRATG